MKGINAPPGETRAISLSLVMTPWEGGRLQTGKGALNSPWTCWHLDLGRLASRTVRNQCLLCTSPKSRLQQPQLRKVLRAYSVEGTLKGMRKRGSAQGGSFPLAPGFPDVPSKLHKLPALRGSDGPSSRNSSCRLLRIASRW